MDFTVEKGRRAAFTLIELLVVIGLMAVLATISVAGYSAARRGMADRSVVQSTVSVLRVAQQTCQIDRVPTKVLFFNQRLSDGANQSEAQLYQGTVIAIRQAGRITIAPGNAGGLLVDEFADWNQSYPQTTRHSDNVPGMRMYRMRSEDSSRDIDGCSVLVKPFVEAYRQKDYMIQTGMTVNDWCARQGRTGNELVWGFSEKNGSGTGLSVKSWRVGDPYGVEIARIDLPRGYIFGTSLPSGDKLVPASDISFDPEDLRPSPSRSVTVSEVRPAAGGGVTVKKVETITSSMLKDDANN